MPSRSRSWNRSIKRWPGWAVLTIMVVSLLAVGVTRDAGPRSAGDRVDDISRRLACPVCDGESVFESRNNASDSIRSEITAQVGDGARTDDEIIEFIADRFGAQVLLVPRSSGIEALAWAIPAAALVCGVAGLAVAFRRWRLDAADRQGASDQDYALVEAALAEFGDEHRAAPPPREEP
jgi:cytochrome c-type biogenesis protein CcmH